MRTFPSLTAFITPLAACAALLLPVVGSAAPRITEFQADNADTIKDEDGDRSDWLEIQNPDAGTASLAGMGLSDDPALPMKWIFPAGTTIPSGGHLIVWASSKNRTNPAAPLHTNFKLSAAAGGYLALTAADGVTRLTEFAGYPQQFPDRAWGISLPVTTQTVISAGASCRWTAPTGGIPNWQTKDFVDTAWTAASTGIGFDTVTTGGNANYLPMIGAGGNTQTQMSGLRNTAYIRIPFNVASAASVQSIQLRMKYDDGFAAFINGARLDPPTAAQTNAPASLAFNSAATATHNDADAVLFASFDVSAQRSALVNGVNVLAIQGLNQSTSSSDMLIVPELDITTASSTPTAPGYLAVASPGAVNTGTPVSGFTDAPDFSVKRGFFSAPFSVALTTNTPGATIRYTTNNTAPTASTGTVYTAPISVSSTTVLRAGAFLTGWQPSTVKTHTYIFAAQVVNQPANPAGFPTTWGNEYNFTTGTLTGPDVVADYAMDPGVTGNPTYASLMVPALTTTFPVVSLSGDIAQIFGFTNGIYSNGRLGNTELEASMEYFNPLDASGNEKFQENVGLRMHGGDAPLEHPKKPFRVYFRKKYGIDRLRYPLFPGSPVDEFDKLQFRPGGHDGWSVPFGSDDGSLAPHATYMRDRFLRQCELDMGRLSPRGRYVHLYLNGLYWGFYDLHEVVSSEFFASHKGGEEADWDVIEHSNTSNPLYDLVEGEGAAMDAALALVRPATNAANPAVYAAIQQYLPLNEFIDHLIVQMWGAQNDWMGPVFRGIPGVNLTDASRFFNKNWESGRRSRGLLPNDGFFWQVWDAEISMGNSLTSLVPTMRVTNFNHTLIGTPATEINRVAGTPGPAAELFYALRKHSPDFRRRVSDRLQKHFFNDGVMTTARLQARLQSFRDQLDLPVVAEGARWGDVNSGNPEVVTFTRDSHWRPEMNWMRDSYVATRNQTLLSQFAAIGMWPTSTAPVYSQHGGTVPPAFALTITNPNAGGEVYYTLDGSDPAGSASGTQVELAGPGTAVRYIVPSSQYAGNSWKNLADPADIASWISATAGLGFDANPTFAPHITSTVTGMQNVRSSLYVRIPFSVTPQQKAVMTTLTLNLKYDDGAYVFLNGSTPLARLNAPTTSPAFGDAAASARSDALAVVNESVDLTSQIAGLQTGSTNLLALQGLNVTAADDDFLCVPQLVATVAVESGPTAGAQLYTGPITLTQTGTVRSRVLLNGTWSPLTEASFIVGVPASASNLTVSEFSYNPGAPTAAEAAAGYTSAQMFEFIELMNISSDLVQLTGVRFDDGIDFNFTLHSSVQQIAAGQRIILASNPAALQFRYPGITVVGTFAEGSNLSNSGERLELHAANGLEIFDFNFDDVSPWPTIADGNGFSLVLINPGSDPDVKEPSNWRASARPNGLPGTTDSDSFTAWADRHGVSGGPSGDPDGNGLTSQTEYALGLAPGTGTTGFISGQFEPVTTVSGTDTYVVLRFRKAADADDVIVKPEMSTDLVTWAPLTDNVDPPLHEGAGTVLLALRSPLPVAAAPHVYVRLTVTPR